MPRIYPPTALTDYSSTVSGFGYGNGIYETSASSEAFLAEPWQMFANTTTPWTSGNDFELLSGNFIGSTQLTVGSTNFPGTIIELQLPNTTVLRSFSIKKDTVSFEQAMPRAFTLVGSQGTGQPWQILYSGFFDNLYNDSTGQPFAIPRNMRLLNRYALVINQITKLNGFFAACSIDEWRLYGEDCRYPPALLTNSNQTLTSQLYGNGAYSVTQSSTSNASVTAGWRSIDNSTTSFWTPAVAYAVSGAYTGGSTLGGVSGEWIKLSCPESFVLKGYTITTPSTSLSDSPTAWSVLGSTNDTTWNLIQNTTYANTWPEEGLYNDCSFNTTAYSFLALVITNVRTDAAGLRPKIVDWQLYADPVSCPATAIPTTRASTTAIPTGVVLPFAGSNVASGYLLCNGTVYSQAAFPNLFTTLGNTYGGDGVTTFAVPDLRGRIPIGNTTPSGVSIGASNITLTTSTLPQHNHTFTCPQHNHATQTDTHSHSMTMSSHTHRVFYSFDQTINAGAAGTYDSHQNAPSSWNITTGSAAPSANSGTGSIGYSVTETTGASITAANAGVATPSPIPIEQPYMVMNYMIKT
jgi:microcystin-dependent protein